MELNPGVTQHFDYAAAFVDPFENYFVLVADMKEGLNANTDVQRWRNSPVNPANLPDSLEVPDDLIQWRIDGCRLHREEDWMIFFALPVSLQTHAPLPIKGFEVRFPNYKQISPAMSDVLELTEAQGASGAEINRFAVSKYVRRQLAQWSSRQVRDFDSYYRSLPFDTKIDFDYSMVSVMWPLRPARRYCTPEDLQGLFPGVNLPPIVRADQIMVERQLHDSVSLVKIPAVTGDRPWVFKTNSPRCLTDELANLFNLPEHPGLLGKPDYLVTRNVDDDTYAPLKEDDDDFLGPNNRDTDPAVFGTIHPYYAKGNLAQALDQRRRAGTLDLNMKFKWAHQLASALLVLVKSPMGYHSSIKPNNIVLNDDDSLRIIDMEQGGNWEEFTPPEDFYLRVIGSAGDDLEEVPEEDAQRYHELSLEHHYWEEMTPEECEKAEVYSLGKVMWCIFEGWAHTKNCWIERYIFPIDYGCEFPNFKNTPPEVKELISECVSGSEDLSEDRHEDDDIVVLDGLVYPKGRTGRGCERKASAMETVIFAQEHWRRKYARMEQFLLAKARWDAGKGTGTEDAEDVRRIGIPLRPQLQTVCERLSLIQKQYFPDQG